jgi:hypothetical protein
VFSNLDHSFTVDLEDGTAPVEPPTPGGGGPTIRHQPAILRRSLSGCDPARLTPDRSVLASVLPGGVSADPRSQTGRAYATYVAGENESGLRLGPDPPAGR